MADAGPEGVAAALAEVRLLEQRADGKVGTYLNAASLLATAASTGVAVVAATGAPTAAAVPAVAALVCLAAAVVVLNWASRPDVRDRGHGFPAWAEHGVTTANAPGTGETEAVRVQRLSRKVLRTFRAVALAVDLLTAALVLLLLAAMVALVA